MTPREVRERLAAIPRMKVGMCPAEDALYRDVLRAIAEGECIRPRECARLLLIGVVWPGARAHNAARLLAEGA